MAFVVARPGGRYEIRESESTPAGPRARTLAAFRVLTSDVLSEAGSRARRPFDAAKIRARAGELGVPRRDNIAAATAQRLVAQLRGGDHLPPALVAELRSLLPVDDVDAPDTIGDAVEWIGRDDETRARVLVDLMDLASNMPQRRRPDRSAFPCISSESK